MISIADNFDHKSKKPLDNRTQYATLADMKAVTDANIPEGCEAYCVATDKYYKFLSSNTVDSTTGKWRERESGGGTSDYTDLTNKPSINNITLSGNKTTSDLGISYNDLTNKPSIPSTGDCYKTSDVAETTLADNDYVPFYDASVSSQRKSLWSNVKSVLKTYFDTIYSTVRTRGTASSGGTDLSLVNTGDMYTWNDKQPKTLSTPLIIHGESVATVEGALSALNSEEIQSATLAANETSVTFSNLPSEGNYLADFYITDGSNYTQIDTSTAGSVTLIYEPISSVRTVYCKIKEV